ncbi:hypothetical protein, partial [Streptosporangium lutulentum]|uniref:hypothetical protein n=1 Tax=Streptosporangium lutulentum TaxID=1461250 RepID=UPI00363F7308
RPGEAERRDKVISESGTAGGNTGTALARRPSRDRRGDRCELLTQVFPGAVDPPGGRIPTGRPGLAREH